MKYKSGVTKILLVSLLSTVLFSVFRKIEFILPLVRSMVDWGWSLPQIIFVSSAVQMLSAGIAVLVIVPPMLGYSKWQEWIPQYLRVDSSVLITGVLSFAGFCVIAAFISMAMGIYEGDLSTVLAFPDIGPEPDVIGWGYFILALVPGIWEELAFRGLIQSKMKQTFSPAISIFLSSLFFSLFHFSNLLTQSPPQVISGVIMAFFFGIGWGYMTVKTRSLVPAMFSHYLVDSMGSIFLNVNNRDPAMTTAFFLILTLVFPIYNVFMTKILYREWKIRSNKTRPLQQLNV
jgi:membrane protease YdiL (CAAX protease family)